MRRAKAIFSGALRAAFLGSEILLTVSSLNAQGITLEPLRRDGYGVVRLLRPRPNVLTAETDIDGRKARLIIDTGWSADGISLYGNGPVPVAAASKIVRNFHAGPRTGEMAGVRESRVQRLFLGNVLLSQVPLFIGNFANLGSDFARRAVGADGIIGAGFLRTCSAILDLQNLRLYLRPPGTGHRADIARGLRGAGLAEVPFEQTAENDCLVDVEINGLPGRMLIDTGTYHALVDIRLAAQIKARPFVTRAGHTRPQTADEFEQITRIYAPSRDVAAFVENAPMTPLRSFRIGGVRVKAPDLRLRRLPFYSGRGSTALGLLGMDILGPNGSVIDFGQQKLYFFPAE